MLKGIQLVKSFRGKKIMSGVNVELERGEIAVVIGPSGSGKTTLLKLLALLEEPDSGKIVLDDREYSFPAAGTYAPPWPKLTVVFQQLFLWPHLTLRQNIKLPLVLRRGEYKGPERREPGTNQDLLREQRRLDDLLGLFDMDSFIDRFPNEASLGQRQRAALVRALVLQPEYLLLDEITSSLDVEQIAIILSYLKRLADRGIGILLVTHLLNFARQAADKVIFLDGGQVIESGTKDVLEKPRQERVKKFLSMIEAAT
jgi:ABC-type polar amino acid transport system ATPase subunit